MKKTIFIIGLLLMYCINGHCQRFKGGISGGINLSQVDGDFMAGYDKIGLNAAVFARTHLGGPAWGQFELKYNGKGAAKRFNIANPNIHKVSLHYIDLPLLLQLYLTEKIIAEAGLSAGYLFGGNFVDDGGISRYNPKQYYSDWDYNIIVGASYLFKDNMGVNFRWGLSIIPPRESTDGYYGWIAELMGIEDGYYNNYLNFTVFYLFK